MRRLILAALCALWPLTAAAQVATAGTPSEGESAGTTALSFSHTVPAGSDRLLTVGCASYDQPPTAVTFNTSESLTECASCAFNNGGERVSIWYRIAPTATTANIDVTFAASEEVVCGAVNFTGVDQVTPIGTGDTDGIASATTWDDPPSVSTSDSNGLVYTVIATFTAGTITPDAGQTEQWEEENAGARESGAGSTKAGGTGVVTNYTLTNNSSGAIAAMPINAAGGGGGGTPCTLTLLGAGKCG